MAAHNNIITRIKDLIGDDVTDITGYKDLINAGFNYIADLIPNNSELWRSNKLDGNAIASLSLDSSKYKIILITRDERVCKEVPLDYLQRGTDPTSIYYNEGNYKNPIFTFTPKGKITIKPTGGVIAIYVFTYFNATHDVDISSSLSDDFNFPEQAEYLGILKCCSNLLQAQISDGVHDDEDQELVGLLNANMASIDKAMQEEMQRLSLPHQLVGDGKDEEFK
jgi:hypothetical protein